MTDYIFNFTDPLKGNFVVKPYTANGNKFPTTSGLSATATSASTPLLLYGKGHPEYGERVQENLLVIAENFSGAAPPIINASGDTLSGIIWHREKLYNRRSVGNWSAWINGSWSSATVTEAAGAPVGSGSNNELYYDNSGAGVLYRYSDDERNIQAWIKVEFTTYGSDPIEPDRELTFNKDGTSSGWVELQTATGSTSFLRIDTTNDPLTGNLEITKSNPTFTLSQGSPSTTVTVIDGTLATPSITQTGITSSTLTLTTASSWNIVSETSLDTFAIRKGSVNYLFTNTITAGAWSVDNTDVSGATYKALVISTGANAIPNKRYVDDAVLGAVGSPIVDGYVTGGSFTSPGNLKLSVSSSHPSDPFGIDITDFSADNITIPFVGSPLAPFQIGSVPVTDVFDALNELENQKASLSGDTFIGDVTFSTNITVTGTSTFNDVVNFVDEVNGLPPVNGSNLTTKTYVDTQISTNISNNNDRVYTREIIFGSGTPAVSLPFEYTAGTNQLFVFRDGIKQYKDVFGFDEISFPVTILPDNQVFGLPSYEIIALAGSPQDSFVITGNHVAEFASGDDFRVYNNTGLGVPTLFTVLGTPTYSGSPEPAGTNITVSSIGSATGDGNIGIDYDFRVAFDGGGLVSRLVNGYLVETFNDLVTQINTSLSGGGTAFIVDNKIRIESATGPIGSVIIADGILSNTTNLFDSSNLGASGLLITGSPSVVDTRNGGSLVSGITLNYYEAVITTTPPGSPLGSPIPLSGSPAITVTPAQYGDTANGVVFAIAPSSSPTEILEFVRI